MMGMVAALGGHAPLPVDPGDPPSGDPSLGTTFLYDGTKVGLQWTNGDATAYTQVGYNASNAEPASALDVVAPGGSTYETGTTDQEFWWVRHLKNGQTGTWVRVFTEE